MKTPAFFLVAAAGFASAVPAAAAPAATNLVVNGNFEQTTNGAGQVEYYNNDEDMIFGNTSLVGWNPIVAATNGSALAWVFAPGTAGRGGVPYQQYGGIMDLWGPGNGGLATGSLDSIQGGNFFAADGDPEYRSGISQMLTGLTSGQTYRVSFEWAAGQQVDFFGPTTEAWQVGFGGQTRMTPILSTPERGFQPWRRETLEFVASGSAQLLSFLAVGTPVGMPPISLLDNVKVMAGVPEPTSWAMLIAGFGLIGAAARRRRGLAAVAS